MKSFLLNKNFPFLSLLKSWLYEAKLLRRKEAQLFSTIQWKKMARKLQSNIQDFLWIPTKEEKLKYIFISINGLFWLYEAKLLRRKEAQLFSTIQWKKMARKLQSNIQNFLWVPTKEEKLKCIFISINGLFSTGKKCFSRTN